MSAQMVLISDIDGFPNYELHYCDEWPEQGRIWSKRIDGYMKTQFDTGGYIYCDLRWDCTRLQVSMHRLLFKYFKPNEWNEDLVINHMDYNRTNNNLDNLEMVSLTENSSNEKKTNCSSKYHGIYWDSSRNKWVAHVASKGKRVLFKRFETEKQAARVRDAYITENNLDHKLNDISEDED